MIHANELRIGNYVFIGTKVTTVEQIMGDENYFEPISLTPEILKRCEFVAINSNIEGLAKLSIDKQKEFSWSPRFGLSVQTKLSGWAWGFENINYLHQLQNLYFALTGRELRVAMHEKSRA